MPQPTIQVSNLNKRFPLRKSYLELIRTPFRKKEITALDDISLSVEKGEMFALLGPNGAGKTTLIKTLCTLILPNEGKVLVDNLDLIKHSKEIRRKIGYVISEERSFYWRLTGRENLVFFSALNNMRGKKADKRINEVIDVVSLESDADKMFKDYSTGMRQKLAIARGLLTSPEILFLDEPTKSLDPAMAKKIRKFIKKELVEQKGITVFLCTHSIQEALMCDRVGVLKRSRLLACGTVEELGMKKEKTEYLLVTLLAKDKEEEALKTIKKFPGISRAYAKTSNNRDKTSPLSLNLSFGKEEDIYPFIKYLSSSSLPFTAIHPVKRSFEDIIENILNHTTYTHSSLCGNDKSA